MDCVLCQPQSKSEVWLDLDFFLFDFQKEGGGGQVKGVRGHSQAKLSKFGSYFLALFCLAKWLPADF